MPTARNIRIPNYFYILWIHIFKTNMKFFFVTVVLYFYIQLTRLNSICHKYEGLFWKMRKTTKKSDLRFELRRFYIQSWFKFSDEKSYWLLRKCKKFRQIIVNLASKHLRVEASTSEVGEACRYCQSFYFYS